MQTEERKQFQLLSICHWLFNSIMDALATGGGNQLRSPDESFSTGFVEPVGRHHDPGPHSAPAPASTAPRNQIESRKRRKHRVQRMEKCETEFPLVQEMGVFDGTYLSLVEDNGASITLKTKNRETQEAAQSSSQSLGRRTGPWTAEEKGKMKAENLELPAQKYRENTKLKASVAAVAGEIIPLSLELDINKKSEIFIRSKLDGWRL